MQQGNWQGNHSMLSNGADAEMSGNRNPQSSGHKTQDDATVGYFFQRPQTDMAQQYNKQRWAVGDDSVIEQVRVNDLERDFQNLTFGGDSRQEGGHLNQHVAKKIWDNDKAGGDAAKGMFAGAPNPWSRDDGWNANPAETVALGVNMAEYVLGGSPVGKDIHRPQPPRQQQQQQQPPQQQQQQQTPYGPGGDTDPNKPNTDKGNKAQSPFEGEVKTDDNKDLPSNGIMQNGLEDRQSGSRQNSPIENDGGAQVLLAPKPDDHLAALEVPVHQALQQQHHQQHMGLQLDTQPFEPMGLDPFQMDYGNAHLLPPSMDSPNFSIDYQQQRQQPIVLTPQQYALAHHQQLGLQQPPPLSAGHGGAAGGAFPSYLLPAAAAANGPGATAQPPHDLSSASAAAAAAAMGLPFPANTSVAQTQAAVMPQYYSVQAPWGIYPAAGLLQQQQNLGQQAAPQAGTPTQSHMVRGHTPRSLTPSQDGGGGLGTPTGTQLGAPGGAPQYHIVAPTYYDQNGQLLMGNPQGRGGLGTPVRLVSPAPLLVTSQQAGNGLQPGTIQILTNQQIPLAAAAGPLMHQEQKTPGAGGSSGNTHNATDGLSERRGSLSGSLDYSKRHPAHHMQQYCGGTVSPAMAAAGPMGLVQAQSLTPPPLQGQPPSLNGSAAGNLAFAGGLSAGLLGSSLLNHRLFPKSASLSKEGTSRSRLLEDFRNNRIPNLQLKDLVNHVVEFSQDQHGSRFIQQKLERASQPEKQMVFNEILSAAYSLMTDVFGNYVIQKFFEFGTPEQKQTLAQRVRGHVLPLALQMYGCRVIQKALEAIPREMQVEIVKELDGHVLKCVKDQNGNHVVQKCIETIDPPHLQFIIDAFKGQVFTLSTHPYGCRVIQRILEHCVPEQTGPILEELHSQTERLVQDQYGNYVIQHVLEHGRPEDKSKIVTEIRGKVLMLSQHKFASNVVEKGISHSSRPERAMLIEEVCGLNEAALYQMMKDQFANYVVQKMIDVADGTQRKMLLHKIRPHVATLRKFTYGKHILAKLEKFYMKTSDLGPIGMPPNGALQ